MCYNAGHRCYGRVIMTPWILAPLVNTVVPHGGDAAWGNEKNIWHNKSLREEELYARAQLSTCVWDLFIFRDCSDCSACSVGGNATCEPGRKSHWRAVLACLIKLVELTKVPNIYLKQPGTRKRSRGGASRNVIL